MKDGRRGFIGGVAAAGAVAATTNPVTAAINSFATSVPNELKKGLTDGSTVMRVSLVEIVNGRREPCRDHAAHDLILRGNSETPGAGEELISEQVSWDVTREMTIEGIRIFGGTVGGRPYQNFAWFSSPPALAPGNVLTVRYTLSFNMDIMSEENCNTPLRTLCNRSMDETQDDRVNLGKPLFGDNA